MRKLVKLPHRIHAKSSSVCLIVKDTESDPEKTADKFKDILKGVDVDSVDMIMPLDTLKKEWKGEILEEKNSIFKLYHFSKIIQNNLGHELKRKLAQQHEIFLADSRIIRLATPHLGKEFMKRRRSPFPIRMATHQTKLIPASIADALRTAQVCNI